MRTTRRPAPKNEYERTVLHNVDTFGWHCTSVTRDDPGDDPPFTYTVGLFETFGAPEMIVFGLGQDVAHSLLGIYARRLAEGDPIALDVPSTEIIADYACVFVPVARSRYLDYVFSALWFYGEAEFPVYQLVWPDPSGRFPWHPEAGRRFRSEQPVLGTHGGS